jgi:hypothetical protein
MLALGVAAGANFEADSNVPKVGDLSCRTGVGWASRIVVASTQPSG